MMIYKWSAKVVDVETVFLYGDLEEVVFMYVPPGMNVIEGIKEDKALSLGQCIYMLVQVARQYYKKAVQILEDIGFV
jgi:hypothetical protein